MIYLDNAATSFPKPRKVIKAVNSAMRFYSNPGRSSYKYSYEASVIVEKTRNSLAELLNCDSENVFFTLNCTDGLSCAIFGILKSGDHVLTTVFEHNSVLRPLEYLRKNNIISYDYILPNESGNIDGDCFYKYVRKNTKMIITTHVSNVCGKVIDIKSIYDFCKSKNIIFCVDAAQSAGSLNVSASMADIICMPGHKGLLGPMGCGILYISPYLDPTPLRMGGTGSESESLNQPKFRPDRYESGTLPFPAIMGLEAGIETVKGNLSEIYKHECTLAEKLCNELRQINKVKIYTDEVCKSGVVLLNIKDIDSKIISDILDKKFGIATRPGFHCAPLAHKYLNTLQQGGVRISIGPNNTEEDIARLIHAIKKTANEV